MSLEDFCVQLNVFNTTIDHLLDNIDIYQLLADRGFEFVMSEIHCPQSTTENPLDILLASRKFEASDHSKVEQFRRWVESKPLKSIDDETVSHGSDANVSLFLPPRNPDNSTDCESKFIGKQNKLLPTTMVEDRLDFCRNGSSSFDHVVPSVSHVPIISSSSQCQIFDADVTPIYGSFSFSDCMSPSPLKLSGYADAFNLSIARFANEVCKEAGEEDNANLSSGRSLFCNDYSDVQHVMKDVLDRICFNSAGAGNWASLDSSYQCSLLQESASSLNLINDVPNLDEDLSSAMQFLEMDSTFYNSAYDVSDEVCNYIQITIDPQNDDEKGKKRRKRKRLFTKKRNQVRCNFPGCCTSIVLRHQQDGQRLVRHVKNHVCEVICCSRCDFRSLHLGKIKSHHRIHHGDHPFSKFLTRDDLCRTQINILVRKCFPEAKF